MNVIPKVLASNAAQDATELVSKLRALHAASQGSDDPAKKELKNCGLDLMLGKVRNNVKAGVLEPMVSKIKSLRFATEAAITILRIDDMIKLNPQQEELPQGRHWARKICIWLIEIIFDKKSNKHHQSCYNS